jgi:hypothetical protein
MTTVAGWTDYSTLSPPSCFCGECFVPFVEFFPRVFECPQCDRSIPWCRGCGDDYPDLCDECWSNVTQAEGEIHPHV